MELETFKFDHEYSAKKLFGLDDEIIVSGFKAKSEWVPEIDHHYKFDKDIVRALLLGFAHNKRVILQGFHGTGKTTHIEQVAARLNWPVVRINLDSQVSRLDLIGRDAIKIVDGNQVTDFKEGMLVWAVRRPVCLILDEYDAGRPEVMFVIQRLLEVEGKLTVLEKNEVVHPHEGFRLFATTNSIGIDNADFLYQGTSKLNAGQLDRWHILAVLDYLDVDSECAWINAKTEGKVELEQVRRCCEFAAMQREAYINGDLSIPMSPRSVLSWVENHVVLADIALSFKYSFYNRLDTVEQVVVAEFFQRCFNIELR